MRGSSRPPEGLVTTSATGTRPRARRIARWIAVLLPAAGVIGLLAYGFWTNPREVPSPLLGRPAPVFSLVLFDGGRLTLAEHAGQVVVVNFWASWCIPCREEAPVLEAAWRAYRDRGVVVVGVNFQDSEAAARAFIKAFGLTFPNGPDPGGRIAIDHGVYGIPETFIVGRDGRIAYKHIGVIGASTLDARIHQTLEGVVQGRQERSGQYQRIQ
ncbi:MAG: TlpA family protein disulfide reductase [Candidatus Rokuibacteriota bacterium]